MEKGLISIIIPTYNRKDMLKEAIYSVYMQSYKNFEILVVDDGSKDGTEEYIKSNYIYKDNFKYFKNEKNSGPRI